MESKKIIGVLLLVLFVSIGFVSAITGSIGNARMVLKATEGETIEKSIRVINVNNISVDIEMFPTGELKDNIDVKDKTFTLGPGEEKKAYFDINVAKAGTTETTMNIKFTPSDGGNGVVLVSTIIVTAEKKAGGGWWGGGNDDNSSTNKSSFVFGGGSKISSGVIFIVVLLSIVIILFAVLMVVLRKTKLKREVYSG